MSGGRRLALPRTSLPSRYAYTRTTVFLFLTSARPSYWILPGWAVCWTPWVTSMPLISTVSRGCTNTLTARLRRAGPADSSAGIALTLIVLAPPLAAGPAVRTRSAGCEPLPVISEGTRRTLIPRTVFGALRRMRPVEVELRLTSSGTCAGVPGEMRITPPVPPARLSEKSGSAGFGGSVGSPGSRGGSGTSVGGSAPVSSASRAISVALSARA